MVSWRNQTSLTRSVKRRSAAFRSILPTRRSSSASRRSWPRAARVCPCGASASSYSSRETPFARTPSSRSRQSASWNLGCRWSSNRRIADFRLLIVDWDSNQQYDASALKRSNRRKREREDHSISPLLLLDLGRVSSLLWRSLNHSSIINSEIVGICCVRMPDDAVSAWLSALEKRHLSNLTPSEAARALRALSSCYVERRSKL